jgi:hypothetical protein
MLTSFHLKPIDIDVWMISCDSCWVWQHGVCVGIEGDWDAPQGIYNHCD